MNTMQYHLIKLFRLTLIWSLLSMGFMACSTGKFGVVHKANTSDTFLNPILSGFYPDPCINRAASLEMGKLLAWNETQGPTSLQIHFDRKKFIFSYNLEGEEWTEFYTFTDGEYLSTRVASRLEGFALGIYAISLVNPTAVRAIFHVSYTGDDELLGNI